MFSAEPVCSCALSFVQSCTRDRGCSAHPAFPAPSDFMARNLTGKPRATSAARTRDCIFSLAPRLRGEGWGEGLLPQASSLRVPLTRAQGARDLSPQARRGDRSRCLKFGPLRPPISPDFGLPALQGAPHRPETRTKRRPFSVYQKRPSDITMTGAHWNTIPRQHSLLKKLVGFKWIPQI